MTRQPAALLLALSALALGACGGSAPVEQRQDLGEAHCDAYHDGLSKLNDRGSDGVRDNGSAVVAECKDGAKVVLP